MTNEYNESTYKKHINDIADAAFGEDPDTRYDWVDQYIRTSPWVVFTTRARKVIAFTDHPYPSAIKNGREYRTVRALDVSRAYYAMRADVRARMDQIDNEETSR